MAKKSESRAPTGIVRHPIYIEHDTGRFHPESPERLIRLFDMLDKWPEAKDLKLIDARKATPAEIQRIHRKEHYEEVAATAGRPGQHLDGDTPTSPKSFEAALYAAGGGIEMVDAILDGRVANGFALVRPPGHHAEADRSMGFCLFNNVAIAAAHAIEKRGLKRVLIIDPDLHHGNATQHQFWNDGRVLYASTHQFPYYPGTGHYGEVGEGNGLGYTVNIPMPPGQGNAEYVAVFEKILKPIALEYEPQLVLVSAGFDTYEDDPLGGMKISVEGYVAMAKVFCDIAEATCGGKIGWFLEGGYNIEGLVASIREILKYLMGKIGPKEVEDFGPESDAIENYISKLRGNFGRHWKSLKQ